MEVRGKPQALASLSLFKRLGRYCVRGRVGPTVGLELFKKNGAVNVRVRKAIVQPLLQWKSYMYFIF